MALALLASCLAVGNAAVGAVARESLPVGDAAGAADDLNIAETSAVSSHWVGIFHRRSIRYTASAARLAIPGPSGTPDAQLFYVAYTADGIAADRRPVTFLMNGGPGSATAWLHLGGLGPKKIVLDQIGVPPPPPARLEDNPLSPLDRTDLVFIDAPGTGYSRVASDDAKSRLFQRDGDLQAFATFIKRYLSETKRWSSPVYLFGESYGGTRAAGLCDVLVRQGVPLSGVVLLSSALDFGLNEPSLTNDLPYVMLVPSYAIVAAYHGKTDRSLPKQPSALIRAAQLWAAGDYARALARGNRLSLQERARVARGLFQFIGIAPPVIEAANLRVDVQTFQKYLLADRGVVGGRVDGRLSGPQTMNAADEPWYDPAMGALTPAYSAAAEQLLGQVLGYHAGIPYRMYSRDVASHFVLAPAEKFPNLGYPETLSALQTAAVKNQHFKILVLGGIYDLAAPFWTTEYEMDHLPMTPSFRRNISIVRLTAGHMAYDDRDGLRQMSDALGRFYGR
ncbi:MAG: peptidase S10 [Candidatus Eremiobacteraeota bacterium]|nr:peptidase S10 [Candidatus Eremiobacteraeota bacterium]